jgi:hypothetical protein
MELMEAFPRMFTKVSIEMSTTGLWMHIYFSLVQKSPTPERLE